MSQHSLFNLLAAASHIVLNGYECADLWSAATMKTLDPADATAVAEFDLDVFDQGRVRFKDQVVDLDLDGGCSAISIDAGGEGETWNFEFYVRRPLNRLDMAWAFPGVEGSK